MILSEFVRTSETIPPTNTPLLAFTPALKDKHSDELRGPAAIAYYRDGEFVYADRPEQLAFAPKYWKTITISAHKSPIIIPKIRA